MAGEETEAWRLVSLSLVTGESEAKGSLDWDCLLVKAAARSHLQGCYLGVIPSCPSPHL